MAATFYVYIIFRRNGVPCYVGKGNGGRWRDHVANARNPHLRNIYKQAKSDLPVVIIREGLTEAEAFRLEREFIQTIGRERNGGPLVNLTDGGDGVTGYRHTAKTKCLNGRKSKIVWSNPETRRRIIAAQTAGKLTSELFRQSRKEIASRPEVRAAQSERAILRLADPAERKRISDATKVGMAAPGSKANQSAGQKRRFERPEERAKQDRMSGRTHSPETRAKMSASHMGHEVSQETRLKLSQQAGWKHSAETRAKMSASAKRRRQKESLRCRIHLLPRAH